MSREVILALCAHKYSADDQMILHAAIGDITVGDLRALLRDLDEAREALRPFRSGWMTSDTEHTARTVIAHMHPERQYELHLSSEDFLRANALVKRLSRAPSEEEST